MMLKMRRGTSTCSIDLILSAAYLNHSSMGRGAAILLLSPDAH